MSTLPDKSDRAALVAAIERAGGSVKGSKFRCPWHEDKNPSGSINQAEDGHWLFRCHGCGARGTVLDALARVAGVTVPELMREAGRDEARPPVRSKPCEVYPSAEDAAETMARREGGPWSQPCSGNELIHPGRIDYF